jgi:hypothetical protein
MQVKQPSWLSVSNKLYIKICNPLYFLVAVTAPSNTFNNSDIRNLWFSNSHKLVILQWLSMLFRNRFCKSIPKKNREICLIVNLSFLLTVYQKLKKIRKINNLVAAKNFVVSSTQLQHGPRQVLFIPTEWILVCFQLNLRKTIIVQNAEILRNGMAGQTKTLWLIM